MLAEASLPRAAIKKDGYSENIEEYLALLPAEKRMQSSRHEQRGAPSPRNRAQAPAGTLPYSMPQPRRKK